MFFARKFDPFNAIFSCTEDFVNGTFFKMQDNWERASNILPYLKIKFRGDFWLVRNRLKIGKLKLHAVKYK